MKRFYFLFALVVAISNAAFSQGIGIPAKHVGIGFGNIAKFTGIRFNFRDKNVEKINGLNVTVWQAKNDSDQTGTVNGISLGLPMAMGHENQNGINAGIGIGATKSLRGINVGVIGAGAGENVVGINIGGVGIGAGGNLYGINFGGIGAGAGGNVSGINFGGLGIGAGTNLSGITFGTLGVGSGGDITGITIGGAGVGGGDNIRGFTIGGVGVGAGHKIIGITIGGVGVGAGEEVKGFTTAVIGVGSPKVTGLVVAMAVGGLDVRGIMIAPAFFAVGGLERHIGDSTVVREDGMMRGLSISAYNRIRGEQRGVALGVVNYAKRIKGFQLGLINIVRENRRGLRVLPIFNTRFKKRT
jgi:hypothetical protein